MNTLEKAQRRINDCLTIYGGSDKVEGDDKSVYEIAKALIEADKVIRFYAKPSRWMLDDPSGESQMRKDKGAKAREWLNSVKGV